MLFCCVPVTDRSPNPRDCLLHASSARPLEQPWNSGVDAWRTGNDRLRQPSPVTRDLDMETNFVFNVMTRSLPLDNERHEERWTVASVHTLSRCPLTRSALRTFPRDRNLMWQVIPPSRLRCTSTSTSPASHHDASKGTVLPTNSWTRSKERLHKPAEKEEEK